MQSPRTLTNGVLAAPRALVNSILPFAYGAAALSVRGLLPTLARSDPKSARAIQKDLDRFQGYKLKPGAHRISQGPVIVGYRAEVPVRLSDLGRSYPVEEMQRLNPKIDLIIDTQGKSPGLGSFTPGLIAGSKLNRTNLVMLNLPVLGKALKDRLQHKGASGSGYKEFQRLVRTTIEHELRHFIQFALAEGIKGDKLSDTSEMYAAHSLGLGTVDKSRSADPHEAYLLTDVEYYPWLGEVLTTALTWAETQATAGVKPRASYFLKYTSQTLPQELQVFAATLKKRAPARYQRLVREVTAAIENWRERQQARASWLRYSTGPRVVTELAARLDRADPTLAASLRQYRSWAEERAKEELHAYRAKGEALRASAAAK